MTKNQIPIFFVWIFVVVAIEQRKPRLSILVNNNKNQNK